MSPWLPTRLLAAQSDRRLVELIRGGHERAFEVLVQRYRRQLLSYCSRMGLSDALAEDVVQHALLQAWMALERGTEVRHARPWLYRIVHNTAVNAVRRAHEEHRPLIDAAAVAVSVSGRDDPERRLAVRETLSDVAALPRMQRDAIVLSAIDGRSHEEVATALGVTDGAVRGLLYRARTALRGAAAALTPAPLIAWASGAASRMTPSAARVAEMTAPGADGPVLLMKGVALAATAALAAGAVLGPLHHRSAQTHARGAAVASLAAPAAQSPARATQTTSDAPVRQGPAVGAAAPAVAHPGGPASTRMNARLTPRSSGSGGGVRVRSPSSSTSPAGGGEAATRAPGVVTASSSGSGSGPGTTGAGSSTAAPPPAAPAPAPGSSGEPAPPPSGGEKESEAARERAEHEAEVARETREREEEAAREKREREEEAAREREAEAAQGKTPDN